MILLPENHMLKKHRATRGKVLVKDIDLKSCNLAIPEQTKIAIPFLNISVILVERNLDLKSI